jgi:DedD protein
MRRRLIGAAALLLGTAVVVPMILDPAPKPLPDNIPIDIPSERTPFAPRLSLPTETGQSAPLTARPEAEGAKGAAPAAGEPTAAANAQKAAGGNSQPADPAPSAATTRAEAGHWFVQAAALSSESAARQLSERLSKAGLSPFVERTDTSDGVLYRVRLGPFSSREAAVKARKHLHALGVGSNVVRVEQADR